MISLDEPVSEQRRNSMKANRSNNTRIELLLRRELFRRGIRYRINRKILTTRPDISIAKYKIAVFCDGDFWHG